MPQASFRLNYYDAVIVSVFIVICFIMPWTTTTSFEMTTTTIPSYTQQQERQLISRRTITKPRHFKALLHYSSANDVQDSTMLQASVPAPIINDIKKEGVKVFGRLAEKYIALDSSGGNCCYSGCTGCEYRLPGGGYKMADQTSSRPKWIPHYDTRVMNDKAHTTKWVSQLFLNSNVTSITQDEFVNGIMQLEFLPPLGGPYISASAAAITDSTLLEHIFKILVHTNTSPGKTTEKQPSLSKSKMSIRIKQLSNGEEGMTWQSFERVFLN